MSSHLQQAIAANQTGDFAAALTHAKTAIELGQDGIKPHLCAAIAAANSRDDDAALAWVEQALNLQPDSAVALRARTAMLLQLHRPEAALESAQRWAQLEPGSSEAHFCCAQLCHELQLYEEASAAYAKAAHLSSSPAPALTNLAILMFELGRRDEASRHLDDALSADGSYAPAWYTRAEAKRFDAADADMQRMKTLLDAPRTGPGHSYDTILLRYALAKAHADCGGHAQALEHLRAASALKRGTLNYDVAIDEEYMREMARAATPQVLSRLSSAGLASSVPIFIVGMPRSGSSLVEQVLASHPEVSGGGESARMQSLIVQLGETYPAHLDSMPLEQLRNMATRYVGLLPVQRRAHVTDKTPYNFLHLGLIHAMFPAARIIHCRRDPIDTCVSVYSTWFASGNEFSYDVGELARFYCAYAQLMRHWRSTLPANSLLEIDYEDMVHDFARQSRRVLEFLELPWADECLSFHRTERAVQTASKHQVREPLYATSVGRAHRMPALAAQIAAALEAARAESGENF